MATSLALPVVPRSLLRSLVSAHSVSLSSLQHAANDGLSPTRATNPPYDSACTTKEGRSIAHVLNLCVLALSQCHAQPSATTCRQCHLLPPDVCSPITPALSATRRARTATRLALAQPWGQTRPPGAPQSLPQLTQTRPQPTMIHLACAAASSSILALLAHLSSLHL
jgi:hypothetical protein